MRFLVSIHHPDDYDPAVAEDAAMDRAIDELNDEMIAAGVRVFVGGLHPACGAKSLRARTDGTVLIAESSLGRDPSPNHRPRGRRPLRRLLRRRPRRLPRDDSALNARAPRSQVFGISHSSTEPPCLTTG